MSCVLFGDDGRSKHINEGEIVIRDRGKYIMLISRHST